MKRTPFPIKISIVLMAVLGSASCVYADLATYSIPVFEGSTDGSQVAYLPKFNPALGILKGVTFFLDAEASYGYSATNSGSTPEAVGISMLSRSDVIVSDPVSSAIYAQAHALASENSFVPSLDSGESISGGNTNGTGLLTIKYGKRPLPEFLVSGSDDRLMVSMDYFNDPAITPSGDLNPLSVSSFAGGTVSIRFYYLVLDAPPQTPAPTAAISMAAGIIGWAIRRRRHK